MPDNRYYEEILQEIINAEEGWRPTDGVDLRERNSQDYITEANGEDRARLNEQISQLQTQQSLSEKMAKCLVFSLAICMDIDNKLKVDHSAFDLLCLSVPFEAAIIQMMPAPASAAQKSAIKVFTTGSLALHFGQAVSIDDVEIIDQLHHLSGLVWMAIDDQQLHKAVNIAGYFERFSNLGIPAQHIG